MSNYNPRAAYHEQPWHTADTLREHCRDLVASLTEAHAKLGLCEYAEIIDKTPQAFRIYGAIAHYVALGYDADHIIAWLDRGAGAGVVI